MLPFLQVSKWKVKNAKVVAPSLSHSQFVTKWITTKPHFHNASLYSNPFFQQPFIRSFATSSKKKSSKSTPKKKGKKSEESPDFLNTEAPFPHTYPFEFDPNSFPLNMTSNDVKNILEKNPLLASALFPKGSSPSEEIEEVPKIDFESLKDFREHFQEELKKQQEKEFKSSCCSTIEEAFEKGHLQCSKDFLENSPELKNDETMLSLAAATPNTSILVELLKDPKTNLNAVNKNGQNAAHYAALYGTLEALQLLAKKGIKLDARDNFGSTPFFYACKRGDESIINFLLKGTIDLSDVGGHGESALHLVISHGLEEITKKLIDRGANISLATSVGHTPLHIAAASNQPKIIQFLIERGVSTKEIDDEGFTPLHIAINQGLNECAFLLIDSGVDVFEDSTFLTNPFYYATSENKLEIVKYILDKNKVPINSHDKFGFSILHHAVSSGNVPLLKLLLNHSDIKIDNQDSTGDTPLMMAVTKNSEDLTKFLLESGANPTVFDDSGNTVLHRAASNAKSEIIRILLQNQELDINIRNTHNISALQLALQRGQKNQIQLFLSHPKIDVKSPLSYQNKTPLHLAVERRLPEIVETLISKGCDVNAVDSSGKTPLTIAKQNEYSDVIQILVSHNAI